VVNTICPVSIFGRGNIADSVPGSLHDIDNDVRNTRVSLIIKTGADKLIECRDGDNEKQHEGKETSDISKTSIQQCNQVTNGFEHSQKGDQLHGCREEDQKVDDEKGSIDMINTAMVLIRLPIRNDILVNGYDSHQELDNVDDEVEAVIVVPK